METKNSKKEEDITRKKTYNDIFLWIFIAVIITCIALWIIIDCVFPYYEGFDIELQDKFSAIGILLNGLAFAGLIITIVMQRKDLNLQEEAIQKQNKQFYKQSFENTLFNLLQNLTSFVQTLEYKSGKNTQNKSDANTQKNSDANIYKGINVFEQMLSNLNTNNWKVYNGPELHFSEYKDNDFIKAEEIYNGFSDYHQNLCLYFRMLYRIFKFIDESGLKDYEKYQYTSFVRAQLSNSQLILLFYNSTLGKGKEKFKSLVETWVLLKNIDKEAIGKKINWIDSNAYERKGRYYKPNSTNTEE